MYVTMNKNAKALNIVLLIFVSLIFYDFKICNAAVYLDGSATGCNNGSTNYNPGTRTCGSGKDTVSLTLADFNNRIVAGATNYMRAGSYYRTANEGALAIASSKSGTSSSPTIIKAYPGEERQVIIGTASNRMQLNPNQGDTSGANSFNYYPNPAITLSASNATIDGLKTFGQVLVLNIETGGTLTNPVVKNCDIGGGGPMNGWGHALFVQGTVGALIKNNNIHHSTYTPEQNTHKAIVNTYSSINIVYENNTFSDGWSGPDLAIGDGSESGGTATIRYNLFMPSPNSSGGVHGIAQYQDLGQILIYQNIFLGNTGVEWGFPGQIVTLVYNNTFVNNSTAIDDWMGQNINRIVYNNIFYNSNDRYINFPEDACSTKIQSDYNIMFNTSGSPGWSCGGYASKTLSVWKSSIGGESHSLSGTNPNFVNPSGTTAADFKRSSYTENFITGTPPPYSIRAGAYITGNEVIGATQSAVSSVDAPNIMTFSVSNP